MWKRSSLVSCSGSEPWLDGFAARKSFSLEVEKAVVASGLASAGASTKCAVKRQGRHTYPYDRAAIVQGVRCGLQAVGRSASVGSGSGHGTHAREVLAEPEGPQISVMVPRPSPEVVAPRTALSCSRPVDMARGPRDCRLRSASEAETVGRRSDRESDSVCGQLVDTRPTGRWRRASRSATRSEWRRERSGRFRHVDGASDSHRPWGDEAVRIYKSYPSMFWPCPITCNRETDSVKRDC